jgi:hypothetical protein
MLRLRELPVSMVQGGHVQGFGRERHVTLIDETLAGRRAPGCPHGG